MNEATTQAVTRSIYCRLIWDLLLPLLFFFLSNTSFLLDFSVFFARTTSIFSSSSFAVRLTLLNRFMVFVDSTPLFQPLFHLEFICFFLIIPVRLITGWGDFHFVVDGVSVCVFMFFSAFLCGFPLTLN